MADLAAEFVEVFFAQPAAARLGAELVEVLAAPEPEGRLTAEFVEVFLVPPSRPSPGPPGTGRAPSTFRFVSLGFQPPPPGPPGAYLRGVTAARAVEYVRMPGSGPGEVRTIQAADVTLGALSSTTIDLANGPDPYGFRLALTELVVLLVENVAGGPGGAVELRPAATDGMTPLLGAGSAVLLPAGSAALFFVASRDGDGWPVASTEKRLSVVETSGVGARVVAHVWGRR